MNGGGVVVYVNHAFGTEAEFQGYGSLSKTFVFRAAIKTRAASALKVVERKGRRLQGRTIARHAVCGLLTFLSFCHRPIDIAIQNLHLSNCSST
jgi:hypothetical protein